MAERCWERRLIELVVKSGESTGTDSTQFEERRNARLYLAVGGFQCFSCWPCLFSILFWLSYFIRRQRLFFLLQIWESKERRYFMVVPGRVCFPLSILFQCLSSSLWGPQRGHQTDWYSCGRFLASRWFNPPLHSIVLNIENSEAESSEEVLNLLRMCLDDFRWARPLRWRPSRSMTRPASFCFSLKSLKGLSCESPTLWVTKTMLCKTF